MNTFFRGLAGLFLITSCVFAQPVAKITGPTETKAGELTVVSSTGSIGDNLEWIKPDGITIMQAGCDLLDSQLFFATTKEGKYEFILIVVDKEAKISYAKHTVVVGKPTDPIPDPDPDPTPDPIPTPGKWSPLKELSKTNADKVNDPVARLRLKEELEKTVNKIVSMCQQQQCPTLQEAKRLVTVSIEDTLLTRSVRFSDWANLWRVPNSNLVNQLGTKDLNDYLNAVRALISGL